MKRGTPELPKFKRLCRRLKLKPVVVGGLLEFLWHFTAKCAPPGDIGKYTDDDIAEGAGWDQLDKGPAGTFVTALVAEHWVDRNKKHRLIVHDWPEHAEDSVHMMLARRRQFFAAGSAPKTYRLPVDERKQADAFYRAAKANGGGGSGGGHDGGGGTRGEKAKNIPGKKGVVPRRGSRRSLSCTRKTPAVPVSLSSASALAEASASAFTSALPDPDPPPPPPSEKAPPLPRELRQAFADRAPSAEWGDLRSEEPRPSAQHPTSLVWHAYAMAYVARYGAEPVRNARVNGMLTQFLRRVDPAEAPDVAAFYVGHPGAFYAARGHPIGLLLLDAEKLRTEWLTGRPITATEARRNEQTAANPFLRLVDEERQAARRLDS